MSFCAYCQLKNQLAISAKEDDDGIAELDPGYGS